jgi:acetate kinase
MKVLVINSGSSSIKYKLYAMPREIVISKGKIENIGEKGSQFTDHYSGFKVILHKIKDIDLIGHRVVHGGERFKRPVLINKVVLNKVKECVSLAPLHNPANLSGILACQKLLPGTKQVAVFDTAFHQTLPDYAYTYGLPYYLYKKFGIRKYGFHGTSHNYVAHEAARILKRPLDRLKIITCHLGNGSSIAAIKNGKSCDTSMGFTPLEGLVMGTRCGDIDPALVTYIMSKQKLSLHEVDNMLNKSSGLIGISGLSNDMRILEAKARFNKRAKLAIDIFVYRIKKYIGSYIAVMNGCDALVFTAGIGENQKRVRSRICQGLSSFLKSKPKILVIPTDEELMIARQSFKLIKS